ncbi:GumC family protein [Flavobacterium sp. N3904]|uniref:GumC family protein n=1 Tax=Flavobacterium sp. N3904 TaxID=2986835 RepID=UPI002224D943|nr:tyrosine-protein kinase family protein [Flavobacterium sp. N3904]
MDFKKEFFKYFQYWPWILLSLILSVGAAYAFIKTVSPTYKTSAVINIDKRHNDNSKINTFSKEEGENKEFDLKDEIMLVTSNEVLSKVVDSLHLNINYFEKGYLQDKIINDAPFIVNPTVPNDSLHDVKYDIQVVKEGFLVSSPRVEKRYLIRGHSNNHTLKQLPFNVRLTPKGNKQLSSYLNKEYVVNLESTESATKKLKASFDVDLFEEEKSNLLLTHEGINPELSRKILDELIVLLDKTIVANKKKLFDNTVSYLNQRIKVFLKEKDSIESVKEKYLQSNDILVLDKYIVDKTNVKNLKKESSMINERQIALTKFAINDIKGTNSNSALGTGYNLDAPTVNQLILNYNATILESQIILQRAQKNNPTYINLQLQLNMQKQAILNTLDGYLTFLNQNNAANKSEQSVANSEASTIPTKDRVLGNIDNNLNLKEVTYLALLQKREEAILNGAVLDSNIKIINPSQTNYSAIFPQPKSFMIGAFMFGLLLPFGAIYLNLLLDTKIHTEDDIHKGFSHIPFLGVIPKVDENKKLDNTASSNSVIAEATRILFSNLSFLLPKKKEKKGNVLLFCSSIHGEGKSFCAFHSAVTISNLNKKVLLIGADLRNPQLHEYFDIARSEVGLSNFLSNKSDDWKEFLLKNTSFSENLDTLFSGEIPPNPAQLLTNNNFEELIEEAKGLYDFIIIDSAPLQLVADTLNYSFLADVTVFIARSDYSDKNTLVQINNFIKKEQLKNVGIVINGVKIKNTHGYNYGSNYYDKYQDKKENKSWFKRNAS